MIQKRISLFVVQQQVHATMALIDAAALAILLDGSNDAVKKGGPYYLDATTSVVPDELEQLVCAIIDDFYCDGVESSDGFDPTDITAKGGKHLAFALKDKGVPVLLASMSEENWTSGKNML
jgi:hypothetical protein